jgi:hypothetical protein
MDNLVQVEFFNVDVSDYGSIEELRAELGEYIACGADIKTKVRFFDDDGTLTRIAERAEVLRAAIDHYYEEKERTGRIRRFSYWKYKWNFAARRTILKDIPILGAEALRRAVEQKRAVAIERNNYSFTPMAGNEALELVRYTRQAKQAWLFVFKPNDLLSEKNELIAHVTW